MLTSRLSLLLFFFVAACGGKTLEPLDDAGTTDGGTKPDVLVTDGAPPPFDAMPPPPPPPSDGGVCNNVDPGTNIVTIVQMQGSPPPFASTGDTIQPGLWKLTALTVYGASGQGTNVTAQLRVSLVSSGYIFQIGSVSDNQAPQHSTEQAQLVSASDMIITETCNGSPNQYKAMVSAEPTTFTLRVYEANLAADETFVYVGP